MSSDLRLHIGGIQPLPGWKILNVQPGPHVDFVGDMTKLDGFADGAVAEIYASHVLEHVSYKVVLDVLRQFHRILRPRGRLMISVPDLARLAHMYLNPKLAPEQRFFVMQMIYGGHIDEFDIHYAGYDKTSLTSLLQQVGFHRIGQVEDFGLFDDASVLKVFDQPISLNLQAFKKAG